MAPELNTPDRSVQYERAALRVAAVVVVSAAVTLIRASLQFDSLFKGFIQGAAGTLALIAVSLAIPAVQRRLLPMDTMRYLHRTPIPHRAASLGLLAVTIGLAISVIAVQRVPEMSGLGGGILTLVALTVVGAGIIPLAVVPTEEPPTDEDDEQLWLPSRDGDV